jgi:hypothetical protein
MTARDRSSASTSSGACRDAIAAAKKSGLTMRRCLASNRREADGAA